MKRLVTAIGVYLLLGAITTVAVAWACAMLDRMVRRADNPASAGLYTQPNPPCWIVREYRDSCSTWLVGRPILTMHDVVGADRFRMDEWQVDQMGDLSGALLPEPFPVEFRRRPSELFTGLEHLVINKRGWPLRALSCSIVYRYEGWWDVTQRDLSYQNRETSWGWPSPLKTKGRTRAVDEVVIPLRPIWTGVVADTAVFAAMWWVAGQFLSLLRVTLPPMAGYQRAIFIAAGPALGVLNTIGVAWGCAALVFVDQLDTHGSWLYSQHECPDFDSWLLKIEDGFGSSRVQSIWNERARPARMANPCAAPEESLPPWAEYAAPRLDGSSVESCLRVVDARGWPMYAMWSALQNKAAANSDPSIIKIQTVIRGSRLSDYKVTGRIPAEKARILPLGIIWRGFVANTAFYWGFWFVILTLALLPWTWRRWWRVRTRRCAGCGYPVGTSPVCTECGGPVKPRAAA